MKTSLMLGVGLGMFAAALVLIAVSVVYTNFLLEMDEMTLNFSILLLLVLTMGGFILTFASVMAPLGLE